jgi:conjugal transfer pilus assembly protein TraK
MSLASRSFLLLLVWSASLAAAPAPDSGSLPDLGGNSATEVMPLPESASSMAAPEPMEVELPPVDASVLTTANRQTKQVNSVASQNIQVKPGVNELMPIALGHLNRLVTPFEHPMVTTTSQATTTTKGKIVYVATADETPVTLYITPGDNQDIALSLTLIPKRIPAREIHLSLDDDAYKILNHLQQQEAKPTSQPANQEQEYITQLKKLFRDLGLQKTPAGFSLREPHPTEQIHCEQAQLAIQTGQALEGQDMVLLVGIARNTGIKPIELDERRCASSNEEVLAVAAWPNVVLAPKQTTELYVVVRRVANEAVTLRPSLLNRSEP